MFELTSVPSQNGGAVSSYGEFSTLRDCTVAARAIQEWAPRERYFSARDKSGSGGGWPEDHKILMSPGEYTADVEIVLSDGRIVWLGDVDEVLRKHLGPLPETPSARRMVGRKIVDY